MTIGVDAIGDVGESDARVGRDPRIRATPIKYVADAIARRRRINRDRIGVEALTYSSTRVGTGSLKGPGRALIGGLEDTQYVGVGTAGDREISAGTLDGSVHDLHAGRIGNRSRRRERNLYLADTCGAGQCGVSRQLSCNRGRRTVQRLSPAHSTVSRLQDAEAADSGEEDAAGGGRGCVEAQRIGLVAATAGSHGPVLSRVSREIQTAARCKVQVVAVGRIDGDLKNILVYKLTRIADVTRRKSGTECDPASATIGGLQNSNRGVDLGPLRPGVLEKGGRAGIDDVGVVRIDCDRARLADSQHRLVVGGRGPGGSGVDGFPNAAVGRAQVNDARVIWIDRNRVDAPIPNRRAGGDSARTERLPDQSCHTAG